MLGSEFGHISLQVFVVDLAESAFVGILKNNPNQFNAVDAYQFLDKIFRQYGALPCGRI